MSKKSGGKSGASTVPEPIVIVPITPAPAGIDPSSLPFPEWSDQDVNSEKWDLPKTKSPGAPTQYVDPQPVELPSSISNNLHEWKRPSQLFPDAELVMFSEAPEYPDLISGSKHLLHSDFMRSFISAISILEYLGNVQPSPMESVTATFIPNTEEDHWRPWHHIYSMTKAGKGHTHDPKVNKIGKYVVRLHWMGAWRKIMVDDRLPVDATNHVLLPKLEKKTIELWPFLLCKALLKLACLTWTNKDELRDFDIVYCLTGWIVHKVDTRGMDAEDIWEMCTGFADHYEWPEEGGGKRKKDKKKLKGKDSKSKGKGSKVPPSFMDEEEESDIIPCHILGTFANMREMPEDLLPDITPCWGHNFLMAQTRDIPINKPPPKPELEHWKKFRWLAWAIRNGLWPFDESMIPIKCVRLVSNFRKCADLVVYKPPSKESTNIQKSVAIVDEVVGKGKKGKDKGKRGKSPDKKESKSKSKSKSKSSSSKSSKGNKKKVKAVPLPKDPSIWVEFEHIAGFIEFLYIFMKPTQFKSYVKISDVAPFGAAGKGKADKGKKSKDGKESGQNSQIITTANTLLESRNEPLYLFMDSLDYKFLVINMCQVGKKGILDKIVEEKEKEEEVEEEPKEVFNLLELLKAIKSKRPEVICPDRKETVTTTTIEEEEIETDKEPVPFSHVVLEQYNWQSNKIDDMVVFLNTYGTKGTFTNIKRGRFVARLWIKSDTPYVINILSDAPIVIGCLELILESMTLESHRTVQMCNDISGSYGQLVQKFGTPDYPEGLRNFYSSYKPECHVKKCDLAKIHETFQKEFIDLLSQYFPVGDYNKYIFAFRVLFIDPSIKYREKPKNENADDVSDISDIPLIDKMSFCSGEILILKEIERAAMTLQAFFKRIYVKKLKSLHDQTNPRYLGIFDTLKKFYSTILNVHNRLPVVSNFLRRWFFYNATMGDIRPYYTVYEDMQSTVILQHFTGTIFAPSNSWVPICRYVFHCNTPNAIKIKICLFCELKKFVVRVIDNDNNNEIERFTNNVNVATYNNNANGYTVLCYGWSNSVQKISWKLTFVTLKQKKESLLIIPEVNLSKDAIVDTYKPNVYNKVCRCLIKIQQDTLVTFRLSVTYENAKIHLRCTKPNGDLLGEIYGQESVILPVLLLEFVPVVNEEMSLGSISSSKTSSLRKRRSKAKSRSNSLTRSHSSTFLKKTQSDVASIRSSVISFRKEKRSSSARASRNESKLSIFKDTVYIIEGFVTADTWPLTVSEWNIVEIYKEKKLLGLEYVMSLFRSPSQSIRSSSERILPRKSTESKRSDRRSRSLVTLEKPFWSLCALVNKNDQVELIQDPTREEQIKQIKTSWYKTDPERYLRSQELRKQYLESHYIKREHSNYTEITGERTSTSTSQSEFRQISKIEKMSRELSRSLSYSEEFRKPSYLRRTSQSTIGESRSSTKKFPSLAEIRFLKKPEPENETLPPFDLEKYQYTVIMTDDEFDDRKLKTVADELFEIQKREKAIEMFQDYHVMFIEDMTKYLYDQIDKANLLDFWYQCCREKSAELIVDGFEEIDDYINKFVEEEQRKAEEAKAASKKDSKKDDKKGKKKKGK